MNRLAQSAQSNVINTHKFAHKHSHYVYRWLIRTLIANTIEMKPFESDDDDDDEVEERRRRNNKKNINK